MAMSRTITIKFNGDTKGLDGATQQGGKQVEGFGQKFQAVNRRLVAGSALVIGAAVKVGKSLVDAGREGIKQDAALAQVFESMGGAGSAAFAQVGDAQQDMSRRLGETATDVAAVQTKLGTFGKVWEDPIKGAENFNRATELAFDLEAAGFGDAEGNVTQLGKALQDPIKGMTALAKSGVSFTDAEKKKIKALQESGDLLGAQEIVYAALEAQVGGVAEATTDGGERMRAQWENLQDTLGRQLIPVFEQLLAIGQVLLDWASQNSTLLLTLGGVIVGLAGFVLAANAVWKVYVATMRIVRIVTIAFAAAMKLVNAVMKANPIGLIITLIAALIAIVVAAYQKNETFRRIVQAVWNAIKNVVSSVVNWFKTNVPAAFNAVRDRVKSAIDSVKNFLQGLLDKVRGVVSGIKGFFSGLGSAISAPFRAAFNGIRSLWNSTVGKISFSIPSWVPGIGGKGFSFPKMHEGGIFDTGRPEGLALLRRGEGVFTPEQMRALGPGGDVTVHVNISRTALEGIAEVVVQRGNRVLKRQVLAGAGVAT